MKFFDFARRLLFGVSIDPAAARDRNTAALQTAPRFWYLYGR
jgi:hypothetical protein